MAGHEDVHNLTQKLFSALVVAEQCISIDMVQVTLLGVGVPILQWHHVFGSIQTEKVVQPSLNCIIASIPDWLVQADLFQLTAIVVETVLLVSSVLPS